MAEELIIEGEVNDNPEGQEEAAGNKGTDPKAAAAAAAASVKDVVGSFGKTVSSTLQNRANAVMVRVNDEALRHMDMLVESDVTKSRSESAAFLITEGIKANQDLFTKVGDITDQIAELRSQLREIVQVEDETEAEE